MQEYRRIVQYSSVLRGELPPPAIPDANLSWRSGATFGHTLAWLHRPLDSPLTRRPGFEQTPPIALIMAPNLSVAQHEQLAGMIEFSALSDAQIAEQAGCSPRAVRRIRSNMQHFDSTKAPPNAGGRPSSITPPMMSALCDHLLENPTLYQDEMAEYLMAEFGGHVSKYAVRRALVSSGWSRKQTRRVAQERNADLRDFHLRRLSEFSSYHLVYVDESGCDKRVGIRRTGWSPRGTAPVQVAHFQRGDRYQILPAYAQDGIVFAQVFQGSTDAVVFEHFIRELLPYCGRFPAPKSVLIMDNASIHHSDAVTTLCREAGVLLIYLPPYSPDMNPIEEFFAQLKRFIKRHWQVWEQGEQTDFAPFLRWCIREAGADTASAEGHFRHAGSEISYA